MKYAFFIRWSRAVFALWWNCISACQYPIAGRETGENDLHRWRRWLDQCWFRSDEV